MSKVVIQGDTNGTGVFTVASPNSNTDRTLTLPDEAGTIITSGSPTVLPKGVPAFRYWQSTQQTGIGAGTTTKVNFQTASFDTTGGMFSSSRFTPTIAGYYQINAAAQIPVTGSGAQINISIAKNGSGFSNGSSGSGTSILWSVSVVTDVVYCNGTTDYIEITTYGSNSGSSYNLQAQADRTYFSGVLVGAA